MPVTAIVFAGFAHETMAMAGLGDVRLERPVCLPQALTATLPNGLPVVFHALPVDPHDRAASQVMVGVDRKPVLVNLYDPQALAGVAAWIRKHL